MSDRITITPDYMWDDIRRELGPKPNCRFCGAKPGQPHGTAKDPYCEGPDHDDTTEDDDTMEDDDAPESD